jgi:hypothetical protein
VDRHKAELATGPPATYLNMQFDSAEGGVALGKRAGRHEPCHLIRDRCGGSLALRSSSCYRFRYSATSALDDHHGCEKS